MVWDNPYLPCQSAEYERWCGDRVLLGPSQAPCAQVVSAIWSGCCPSIHLLPEVTITEGSLMLPGYLAARKGSPAMHARSLQMFGATGAHSVMPHTLQAARESASLPMLVQSWRSGQGVQRPGVRSFHTVALSSPGAAVVFAGSSCGLAKTWQDMLWVRGVVLPVAPAWCCCFLDTLSVSNGPEDHL